MLTLLGLNFGGYPNLFIICLLQALTYCFVRANYDNESFVIGGKLDGHTGCL